MHLHLCHFIMTAFTKNLFYLCIHDFSIKKKFPDISRIPDSSRTTYYVSHKHLSISFIGFLRDLYDLELISRHV